MLEGGSRMLGARAVGTKFGSSKYSGKGDRGLDPREDLDPGARGILILGTLGLPFMFGESLGV